MWSSPLVRGQRLRGVNKEKGSTFYLLLISFRRLLACILTVLFLFYKCLNTPMVFNPLCPGVLCSGVYPGHDDGGTVWHHGPDWYQAERHPRGHPDRLRGHWSGVHRSHRPGKTRPGTKQRAHTHED